MAGRLGAIWSFFRTFPQKKKCEGRFAVDCGTGCAARARQRSLPMATWTPGSMATMCGHDGTLYAARTGRCWALTTLNGSHHGCSEGGVGMAVCTSLPGCLCGGEGALHREVRAHRLRQGRWERGVRQVALRVPAVLAWEMTLGKCFRVLLSDRGGILLIGDVCTDDASVAVASFCSRVHLDIAVGLVSGYLFSAWSSLRNAEILASFWERLANEAEWRSVRSFCFVH